MQPQTRRPNTLAVHSVDCFAFSVPDLAEAERFYTAFGLEVRREGGMLTLRAFGDDHVWARIFTGGVKKKIEYATFGIYAADVDAFAGRIAAMNRERAPHPLGDAGGLWLEGHEGLAIQLVVAPKVSPSLKSPHVIGTQAGSQGAAPSRSKTPRVHPRHLSHILFFANDVPAAMKLYGDLLGLRLSDHSGPGIAFMHGAHGSDHHLVALAHAQGLGLHHSSWDVGSVNEVGAGAEFMKAQGYDRGWGVGRHVLGSNYFYYVRDPWGSYAEYSFDIDFIPADMDWPAADHPPEDSIYVWGPALPEDFVVNYE
jgi:catechol 2,3-dioxygenase-like lactoylglutathione lyase family enzyme